MPSHVIHRIASMMIWNDDDMMRDEARRGGQKMCIRSMYSTHRRWRRLVTAEKRHNSHCHAMIKLLSKFSLFAVSVSGMRRSTSTLLVATRKDEASLNIFNALQALPVWTEVTTTTDNEVALTTYNNKGQLFHLWLQDSPLLSLDYANQDSYDHFA